MIIISGASDNHSKSLLQFIKSIICNNDTNIIIVIYDLGLNINNKLKLTNKLKEYNNLNIIINTPIILILM